MPPYRFRKTATEIGLCLCALFCAGAADASAKRTPAKDAKAARAERRYRAGVQFYVKGERREALAEFRKALDLDPANPAARTAAERLALELAVYEHPGPALPPETENSGAGRKEPLGEALFAAVSRHLSFERTLGDAWAAQGTLAAMQGRVAQLLSERRLARIKGRTYAKEYELRALVRRLPVVLA